jgi:uncharacterized membrane protein
MGNTDMVETAGQRLTLRDLAEIIVGGCVLAFPVAVTEEVWTISESLPLGRVLYLSSSSLLFIGLFSYHRYFSGQLRGNVGRLVIRVLAIYFVTLASSATILLALNHLTTVETVSIAIKRVVIVSFPASFAATVVDGMSRD